MKMERRRIAPFFVLFASNSMRTFARYETGPEHVAGVLHGLKVRDIELLPSHLKEPIAVIFDKRKGKLYFGRRKGINKYQYLKVVVRVDKAGNEAIVTICASKRCR